MDEEQARKILSTWVQPDGGLYCLGKYISWTPGEQSICLDDYFTPDELEAMVWWMRNTKSP